MPMVNEHAASTIDFAQRMRESANQRPRLVESQLDPGSYLRGSGELEILFPCPQERHSDTGQHAR